MERVSTLCWDCANACGGCSWSRKFIPVEGWTAEPTKREYIDSGYIHTTESYMVKDCPEFVSDYRKTPTEKRGTSRKLLRVVNEAVSVRFNTLNGYIRAFIKSDAYSWDVTSAIDTCYYKGPAYATQGFKTAIKNAKLQDRIWCRNITGKVYLVREGA